MGRQNTTPSITDNMGRIQYPTWINESGLYALIFGSKLPSAKRFKRWVTNEVLPAIRKTGKYEIPQQQQYQPTRPLTTDDYEEAARTIAKCHNSRLPIVIDLYRKAGLNIGKIPETQEQKKISKLKDNDRNFIELLNQYGIKELVEKLGICKTSLYYYRVGKYKPSKERKELIIKLLTEDNKNYL